MNDRTLWQKAVELGGRLGSTLPELSGPDTSVGHSGLFAVHRDIPSQLKFFERFRSAKSVDMALVTGRNVLLRYWDLLRDIASGEGSRVRIVLTNPDGEEIKTASASRALCPGFDIAAELLSRVGPALVDLKRAGSVPETVQVRLRTTRPTCNIILVDSDRALVTPFLEYLHSSEVPSFEYANTAGSLLPSYANSFQRLWGASDPDDFFEWLGNRGI